MPNWQVTASAEQGYVLIKPNDQTSLLNSDDLSPICTAMQRSTHEGFWGVAGPPQPTPKATPADQQDRRQHMACCASCAMLCCAACACSSTTHAQALDVSGSLQPGSEAGRALAEALGSLAVVAGALQLAGACQSPPQLVRASPPAARLWLPAVAAGLQGREGGLGARHHEQWRVSPAV